MCTLAADTIILLLLITTAANALITGYQPRFSVYWNIPSEICFSQSSITSVEDYGFIVNTNHSFYGEHIVTLYSNKFGAYPCYDEYGVEHFGGLPQKANLTEHLLKVKADIKVAIPNENFNGLAIIDYEEWRPLFAMNWGSKHIYQQKSVEYVYNRTRNISKKSAISIATIEFERYALRFMTATLQLGKKLRPKGKWGFYGFPYCNSEAGRSELTCSPDFQRLNNWLIKLLWHANVLYPSIYFSGESPTNYNYLHAAAVLTEAKRLSLMFQQPKPVYAFTKFEYNSYSVQNTFYKRADLCASIAQSFNLGIDGLIFWSTSKRIRERCSALNEFVQTVVGPYVQAITAFSEYCSIAKCSGNGKCVFSEESETCNDHTLDTKSYQCSCDKNWYNSCCSYSKHPSQLLHILVEALKIHSPTQSDT